MPKLSKRERLELRLKEIRRMRIIISLATFTTILAFMLSIPVFGHQRELAAARLEHEQLLKQLSYDTDKHAELRQINPDYVGWLEIGCPDQDCMIVDTPVVRGDDNERYLDTTFAGTTNKIGSLFMDYRVETDSPHLIIYGHNLCSGDKFGKLRNYLNERYLSKHPTITFRVDGEIRVYEIFSVRKSDINDPAYHLDFRGSSPETTFAAFLERNNAPADVKQVLTLSTCLDNEDGRLIIQGFIK